MRSSSQVISAGRISRSAGAPGTPSAWVTPPAALAASARGRLVLSGGFTVTDRQQRRLDQQARRRGFADLHHYLEARSQADATLAQLASELDTTVDIVRGLITQHGVHRSPRPVRSARQRRHTTDQQLAARAAQLGFPTLRAYLADRTRRRWPTSQLARQLGVHPTTIRRQLDQHSLHARQPAVRPAAATSRQLATWAAMRQARLAGLGFADIGEYLRVRRVGQGWSLRRVTAELAVGSAWLKGQMRRLGIP
jgi:hypothetical protein